MHLPTKTAPRRKDDRIVLQFDYDCFYAQVLENKTPALKALPLGVRQKNILATCNYNARGRGVKKLMLASEAKKLCPDLVLVEGEDLTPFRDVSKTLFNFLRSHSWNKKVERLGLDEVFMDVTDLVDYNVSCLNQSSLDRSFFCLSKDDPELGFNCNLTSIAGCVQGAASMDPETASPTYLRLLLGSHLASYLRLKLEEDFGYTSTCGISTNKLLSKLVGSKNKPRNQTTLLTLDDDDAVRFMDSHLLRSIPGLGFKTASVLESHVTGSHVRPDADSHSFDSSVIARETRIHPNISPASMESLLGGPGSEKGVGARVWGLLHGVDPTEVKEASDVPSQISIEDTYKGLETLGQIVEELHKLSHSLIRRMKIDLLVPDENAAKPGACRWIARPKTLRLSIRSWPLGGANQSMNYNRISRSGPLPSFVFNLEAGMEHTAERLVSEALLPLLRRLQAERGQRWNLQLINICAANMVTSATDDRAGAGRDISVMFRRQDEALRPWKVADGAPQDKDDEAYEALDGDDDADAGVSWESAGSVRCDQCGHAIPPFALSAHVRFHELGE